MQPLTPDKLGSELHRLKPMQEGYDQKLFNKLYRVTRPVIRNLVKQIDHKRYNLTPDILASFFTDKFLFVFNKYYGTCSEDHLQARILTALSTYKNKLLRSAYGNKAEYNQSLTSMEELYDSNFFDGDTDIKDDHEEFLEKEEHLREIYDYMNQHLSPDASLLFSVLMDPPEFLQDWKDRNRGMRISNVALVDFFELKRTKSSVKYIARLREDIEYYIEKAKEDLGY